MRTGTATFERHDTPSGQRAMQDLHDTAVRHGATCRANNTTAKMSSSHESRIIQESHDIACKHGAICHKVGQPSADFSADPTGSTKSLQESVATLFRKAGVSEAETNKIVFGGGSGGQGRPISAERRKAILSQSPAGRQILREEKQKGGK